MRFKARLVAKKKGFWQRHGLDFATCEQQLAASKAAIGNCFTIRDLAPANVYLGTEISQDASTGDIALSQQRYTAELLERYRLSDAQARPTPLPAGARLLPTADGKLLLRADGRSEYRAIVGGLNCIATSTLADIAQAVSALGCNMAAPSSGGLRASLSGRHPQLRAVLQCQ
ncbi:hypothetical protein GPECTOR_30g273 [Gonium pectorale]|uniref:Reverse transcriptase Ty1/copia-type domain-containing protein n=1 Tax=Gonium pectorale TaxID=33097 RepID=A0A150GEA2_GONPE|nr:hypothetical protein GPECTOR_30g273 [Gonium pectorale]|eukprot:KXZ48177.1 hypothetical protein GPECTOR_30g273 [Gonium pectorale]